MTGGRKKISFPNDEIPYQLSNAEWSAPRPYTHKQQEYTQQAVFTYICAYSYLPAYIHTYM